MGSEKFSSCRFGAGKIKAAADQISASTKNSKDAEDAAIAVLEQQLAGTAEWLILGTGDSPKTIPFYQKCGFVPYCRIPHFFLEHYDHPMIEDGVLLDDMVYLRKSLS